MLIALYLEPRTKMQKVEVSHRDVKKCTVDIFRERYQAEQTIK